MAQRIPEPSLLSAQLTECVGEPLRLVVVLDHDADGVHGDHGEDGPEPPLRLAHLADADARPPHLQAPVALRA